MYFSVKVKLLTIYFVSTESVRRSPEYRDATAASIEKIIKEWLRTARDRDGGRRRRENRPAENN